MSLSRNLLATMAAAGLFVLFEGCGGSSLATVPDPDAPGATTEDSSAPTDAGTSTADSSTSAEAASPPSTGDDGPPTRIACTSTLGTGLAPTRHGRLDGQLVAIVAPNDQHCPSDYQHLHLQVAMGGATYDIAVNLDGFEGELDAKLPGTPFAEGWHPLDLDYVRDFGLHSSSLTLTTPGAVRARVELALANANHISVYGTPYPGSDGAHLVHRNGKSQDGALIINPLAAKAHVIAFRFASDTF